MTALPHSSVPAALAYVRDRLAKGHSLAKLVLASVHFENGSVFSSLPSTLPPECLTDFPSGGKLPASRAHTVVPFTAESRSLIVSPRPSTNDCLAGFANAYLKIDQRRLCVFEDVLSRPTDPSIKLDPRIVTFEDENLFVITAAAENREVTEQTIRDADALWYFMCIGVQSPPLAEFSASRRFSAEDLGWMAQRVDWLAVGAYDGEGYVIWKHGAEPPGEEDSASHD